MKFNGIDRFSESHEATLANITVILYERLGCTQDLSYDYILEKLREIEEFDSGDTIENAKWKINNSWKSPHVSSSNSDSHGLYAYLWKAQHGLIQEDL